MARAEPLAAQLLLRRLGDCEVIAAAALQLRCLPTQLPPVALTALYHAARAVQLEAAAEEIAASRAWALEVEGASEATWLDADSVSPALARDKKLAVRVQTACGLLCFDGYVNGIDSPDDATLSSGIASEHVLARSQSFVVIAMRAIWAHSDTA